MVIFQRISAFLILLSFSSATSAQVTLAWKLQPGDQFLVEELIQTKQTLIAKGNEERHDVKQTRRLRFTVLKKNADGSLLLEQKFEKVQISMDGKETAADILKPLTGLSLKFIFLPPRKIKGSEGYEEMVNAMAGADKDKASLVRTLIPEDSLAASLETLFVGIPDQAVELKATWKTETLWSLGPLGTMRLENTCTLAEVEKDMAKITLTSQGVYGPPPPRPDLKIPRGNLRIEETTGTYSFDVARGRLDRADIHRVLKGTLGFVTPTANVDMTIRMEQAQQIRVLDANKDK